MTVVRSGFDSGGWDCGVSGYISMVISLGNKWCEVVLSSISSEIVGMELVISLDCSSPVSLTSCGSGELCMYE